MTFRPDFFTQLSYLRKVLGEKLKSTQVLYDGVQENAQSIDGFLNYRHAFH